MRLMGSSRHSTAAAVERSNGQIVLTGAFKKLKNGKRKYFVLRDEEEFSSPRLEYYDSEKKFNAGQMPKRGIALKTCFDIGKRPDPKFRNVIALYTKDDCFCFIVDNDDTFNVWLKKLIALQRGELDIDDANSPIYDNHVWMVHVLCKSLGTSSVINPRRLDEPLPYKVSLTDRLLIFLRMEYDNDGSLINSKPIEFPLTCIRSCGHLKNYFLLELGRCSVLGPGEMWIQTEDSAIAENFCKIVLRSMPSNSSSKEELCPQTRTRASSATEATKPEMAARRQRPVYTQGFAGSATSSTSSRERCDSMPSRARTSSEGTHAIQMWSHVKYVPKCTRPSYATPHDNNSPPSMMMMMMPMTPPSASTDSAGSSLSVDESLPDEPNLGAVNSRYAHSITPEETIAEEDYTQHHRSSQQDVYQPINARMGDNIYYVAMSPGGGGGAGKHANTSPTASSSSITSGTPSTDIRFAELPLERIPSYIGPSEEDLNGERTARAYSVGSRPNHGSHECHGGGIVNSHHHGCKAAEKSRERALSVGSKGRKMPPRILHSHACSHQAQQSGAKSSSAPILANSRTYSSSDPMDDLMEIDFSKQATANHHNASSTSGYVEMKPVGGRPNGGSGYVEMKPGGVKVQNAMAKTPDQCPYMDMRPGTSPTRVAHVETIAANDYMEMDPKRSNRSDAVKLSSSPLMASLSPTGETKDGYMDMNFNKNQQRHHHHHQQQQPHHQHNRPERLSYCSDHYLSSGKNSSSSSSPLHPQESPPLMDYMDMNFQPRNAKKQPNDGYVEMSLGNGSRSGHQRQSSLDSATISPDYTNISIGASAKKERRPSKKEKTKSQPIQIQNNQSMKVNNGGGGAKGSSPGSGGSPMCGVFYPRKYSTGTSPNMMLPLSSSSSPYSSLKRQHSRKNSTLRRDSRDSSSSSINTPSSSSTIFPISLNSPSSPVKPPTKTVEPVVLKVPPGVLNVRYHNDDYTMMDPKRDFSGKSVENENRRDCECGSGRNKRDDARRSSTNDGSSGDCDYVNYNPAKNKVIAARIECGDYAIMKPGCRPVTLTSTNHHQPHRLPATRKLVDNIENCFRPISSNADQQDYAMMTPDFYATSSSSPCCDAKENHQETKCQQQQQRPSSVSSEKSNLSRPSSTSSDVGSTTSTIIGINSRPSSSNSERIAGKSGADVLHYASLDLVNKSEDERTTTSNNKVGEECAARSTTPSQQQQLQQQTGGCTYADIDFVKRDVSK